jgi:hypothetical protein
MSEPLSVYQHYDWSRIEAILRTWPGASRISPDALDAYVSAVVYPNGRDRAARTDDPVEVERTLLELMQEDTQGKRPPIGVVVARLGLRRALAHAEVAGELDDVYKSEPAEDWVVAHALDRGLPITGLLIAVARRHGRNVAPEHDRAACELCEVERLEQAKEAGLELAYGPDWRRIDAATLELADYVRGLDVRYPWRLAV